jgi:hypothetical protein
VGLPSFLFTRVFITVAFCLFIHFPRSALFFFIQSYLFLINCTVGAWKLC